MALHAVPGLRMVRIQRRVGPRVPRGAAGGGMHAEEVCRLVTAGAGERGHRGMVDGRAGEGGEVGARVAALAGHRADRDVGRRHAGGAHAVVAAGAVAGDALVREGRAGPGQRRVAGIAFQVGDDVRGRLALRLRAVVAGGAAAARLGVVEVHRRLPGNRGVAGGALIGGEDVVGRLCRGADRGADPVAGAAILRRALEHGVRMAGLAAQVAVLPDEFKARRQVIEHGAFGRGERGGCHGQQQQCQVARAPAAAARGSPGAGI